ncbi:hypothetical protein EAF24_10980, partial [Staphylococcus pseudintermedius]|nr:hypothetical protein [Staphylococcus pseudintermedius]
NQILKGVIYMKKMWLSILLSILIPGLGHIYIKDLKPGISFLILSFILSACIQLVHSSFTFLYLILWVYVMINVIKKTNKYNQGYQ